MEWVIGLLLFWGGHELGSHNGEKDVVIEREIESTVSTEFIFKRGRYYKTDAGYYISNLTPKPQKAIGCDRPVLIADLTGSLPAADKMKVTEVQMECDS